MGESYRVVHTGQPYRRVMAPSAGRRQPRSSEHGIMPDPTKRSETPSKVDEEVAAFLNDKRRANALLDQHKLDTPEMAAIDARYAELEDEKLLLERAAFHPPQGVKRLDLDRYYELRAEIEREQETLQRRRIVNRDAQPLREGLRYDWTVEEWRSRPLEWRRAVIRLVVERIEVTRKIGHGGAEKGQYGAVHNPDRIKVKLAG
jgi:hypothetical protein